MSSVPTAPRPGVLADAQGWSDGLRAHWLWLKSLSLLIDAGEGVSTGLDHAVGSPRVIALTHGHSDHILGLPALLAARQLPTLHSGGPITVVYPKGCPSVAAARGFMDGLWPSTPWDRIIWQPVTAGAVVPLTTKRDLVVLDAQHSSRIPCVSYAVTERRRRLTAAARAMPVVEREARLRAHGAEDYTETYTHTLVAHSGDGLAIPHAVYRDADVLVHDCTFLDAADRTRGPSHATLAEVSALAREMGVGTLVLTHVSARYDRAAAREALRTRFTEVAGMRVFWLDRGEWIDVHTGSRPGA